MLKSLSFLLLSTTLAAQAPSIQWQRTFGGSDSDEAFAVVHSKDGGYHVFGHTQSINGDIDANNGYQDYWVLCLDSLGNLQWKKNFGGSGVEWLYNVRPTPDGGYLLSGITDSDDFDVSGFHGGYWDAWLMKMDGLGNLVWQKCLGGSGWDEAWDAYQTDDGGYIMAGYSNSNDGDVSGNHGAHDYWVVRLDSLLQIVWQRSFGGSNSDYAHTVSPTADGGFIVAGYSQSDDGDVVDGTIGLDVWVLKLNFDGKIEWQRTYGGNGTDRANEIHQTRDGGFIFIGYTTSNNGDITGHHGSNDIWVVKLSPNGALEWQRAMGGSGPDYGFSIQQTLDEGYVLTGPVVSSDGDVTGYRGGGDFWVAKLSEQGEIVWSNTLGGTKYDNPRSIRQTSDGGFIVGGFTWSNDFDVPQGVKGRSDYWVVKLGPEGASATVSPLSSPLSISPNPAVSSLRVEVPTEEDWLDVSVKDMLGSERLRQRVSKGVQLDISALPQGTYLLWANGRSGTGYSGRFVVLR
jgi:hypothetical protein